MLIEVICPKNKFWEMMRRKHPANLPQYSSRNREEATKTFVDRWQTALMPWTKYFQKKNQSKNPVLCYRSFKYISDESGGQWFDVKNSRLGYQILDESIVHSMSNCLYRVNDDIHLNQYGFLMFALIQVFKDFGKHRIPQLWIHFPDDQDGLMAKMQLNANGEMEQP